MIKTIEIDRTQITKEGEEQYPVLANLTSKVQPSLEVFLDYLYKKNYGLNIEPLKDYLNKKEGVKVNWIFWQHWYDKNWEFKGSELHLDIIPRNSTNSLAVSTAELFETLAKEEINLRRRNDI